MSSTGPLLRRPDSLLELPYTQRQLIVVERRRGAIRPPEEPDAKTAFAYAGRAVTALGRAARDRLERRRAARAARIQDQRPSRIEMSTAVAHLRFPPGHPHERVVYVADPVRPRTYYPAAEFHRRAFERKFADATRMLMELGATSFEVLHREGWGEEFAGSLSVGAAVHRMKSRTRKEAEGESEILFRAELDPREPVLPDDVPWLEEEPSWQNVVRGRMRRQLKRFSLSVTYYDAFRIDSEFEDKMKVFGVEVGGKLERFRRTRWDLYGEFSSLPQHQDS